MEGKIFKVIYGCGYAGADKTFFVIAKNKEQVEKVEIWANEGLPCGFTVTEATEDDLYNWSVDAERIPDITKW